MREGGSLAGMFGWLVGTGPGAGFGLLILICGIGGTLVGISGYFVRDIQDVNQVIPDYHAPPIVGLVKRLHPFGKSKVPAIAEAAGNVPRAAAPKNDSEDTE
jgi:hypothetical protein